MMVPGRLDNIRTLVNNGYTVLRVELEEFQESVYAEYDSFYIAGEDDKYRIHVSGYRGNAAFISECECDAVTPSNGNVVTHTVKLDVHMFLTNCMNSTGHMWTMIQRRVDGSVNFYRGWAEYKSGFGDLKSEFWIGLENIRLLVNNGYTVLRVELEDLQESVYAEYGSFYIAGEEDNYRIYVSGYRGNAGDGISFHNTAQFTTYDDDNDINIFLNEAQQWRGAWWYHSGHWSNLNGEYGNNKHGEGVNWFTFKGWWKSLSATRMMLRRT
ncbi:microfibril-associated glycoprotein 4-like [Ostrea edulis]|uniref:microfibril-associated glycoprotein 4-like n=1 Tax=Ostrea edulis TaxID=37623 RepID=UPI0024AF878F|nr:microfibril-associated glycoprotein 4-like [Ostrea edulis]